MFEKFITNIQKGIQEKKNADLIYKLEEAAKAAAAGKISSFDMSDIKEAVLPFTRNNNPNKTNQKLS